MLNSKGEFLLTKRSANKGFPNMWESTGGSALSGEDSLRAALREVREETGLCLDPVKGTCILRACQADYIRDVWLFRQDFELKEVVLQPGETTDKMYANKDVVLNLYESGLLVPYDYLRKLLDFAGLENAVAIYLKKKGSENMAVRLNEDKEMVASIKEGLKRTGGYCPCRLQRTEENKCICKEFREQIADPDFKGYINENWRFGY